MERRERRGQDGCCVEPPIPVENSPGSGAQPRSIANSNRDVAIAQLPSVNIPQTQKPRLVDGIQHVVTWFRWATRCGGAEAPAFRFRVGPSVQGLRLFPTLSALYLARCSSVSIEFAFTSGRDRSLDRADLFARRTGFVRGRTSGHRGCTAACAARRGANEHVLDGRTGGAPEEALV